MWLALKSRGRLKLKTGTKLLQKLKDNISATAQVTRQVNNDHPNTRLQLNLRASPFGMRLALKSRGCLKVEKGDKTLVKT